MKNNHLFIALLLSFFALSSCTVTPKKIDYGNDHCAFCDMTVVDETHAAQYVTKKGRSYQFDAIECLVNQLLQDKSENKMAFVLVANYAKPGELVAANAATYIITEAIKSPMGANLTAFSSIEMAKKTQSMHSGQIYTWEELKAKFTK